MNELRKQHFQKERRMNVPRYVILMQVNTCSRLLEWTTCAMLAKRRELKNAAGTGNDWNFFLPPTIAVHFSSCLAGKRNSE